MIKIVTQQKLRDLNFLESIILTLPIPLVDIYTSQPESNGNRVFASNNFILYLTKKYF